MTDRRLSDLVNPNHDRADVIQRSDWIIGLLSALVLAIVLYAAVFGLGRNDQDAAMSPDQSVFSMAQLEAPNAPIAKTKDKAR